MRVDCDRCEVRGPTSCGDCVVTVLLGAPPDGIELEPEQMAAIGSLAEVGLVAPLRWQANGTVRAVVGQRRSP